MTSSENDSVLKKKLIVKHYNNTIRTLKLKTMNVKFNF